MSQKDDLEVTRLIINSGLDNDQALCKSLGIVIERSLDKFLTQDSGMIEVKERVKKLSPSSLAILILGESGVGKELIARAIHEESRVKGSFVGVNCAGIPGELLESEFFGAKKGAFTGAWCDRSGLLHEANDGTLFLDEIGDMPLLLQCKLLRALEDRVYRRLGENKEYPLTCRIVSATNKDKIDLRTDLYYRLAGSTLHISPLRERRPDIRLICESKGLTTYPFQEWLTELPWNGNVRELLNKITEYKLLNN
jgi:two-component system response regulator PilR (NtrC family)